MLGSGVTAAVVMACAPGSRDRRVVVVYSAAPADATGIASGLFRTAQYVGANLAAAAIALVFAGPSTDAGLHRLGLLVAVIAAILLVDALEPGPSRRIK
jgi:sugar phosphate permease